MCNTFIWTLANKLHEKSNLFIKSTQSACSRSFARSASLRSAWLYASRSKEIDADDDNERFGEMKEFDWYASDKVSLKLRNIFCRLWMGTDVDDEIHKRTKKNLCQNALQWNDFAWIAFLFTEQLFRKVCAWNWVINHHSAYEVSGAKTRSKFKIEKIPETKHW